MQKGVQAHTEKWERKQDIITSGQHCQTKYIPISTSTTKRTEKKNPKVTHTSNSEGSEVSVGQVWSLN